MLFIRSGCLDKSLNSCAGSLFPPSMLNITCGVLHLMVRPLLHVLVGPSKNNGFRSIFLLSHNDIFHACVLVFFVTTKFQSCSQVFEFYICQDLSDKITQLTFFPQGSLFFMCEWLSFVGSLSLSLLMQRNCFHIEGD